MRGSGSGSRSRIRPGSPLLDLRKKITRNDDGQRACGADDVEGYLSRRGFRKIQIQMIDDSKRRAGGNSLMLSVKMANIVLLLHGRGL